MPKKEAMKKTLGSVVKSALVSATILAVAGFALGVSSSEEIVKVLGMLLGRGALCYEEKEVYCMGACSYYV